MKRPLLVSGLLALLTLLPTPAAARGEFDPAANGIRLDRRALRTFDFESPESLLAFQKARWVDSNSRAPGVERLPIAKAEEVASLLTSGEDAIEGAHAVRLGKDGFGLALVDDALFSEVQNGKLEVSLWARSDGTSMQLSVVYNRDSAGILVDGAQFASVRAVRTGRETTDGWAEYATGPIDGSVWGVPARAIVILPSYYAEQGQTFLVDALEIRAAEGKPLAPLACTPQTVDAVCGAEGDCMYGHCVPSTFTWGVLPSPSQRREIAERWIQFSTRFNGDRNATQNAERILAPNARLLARDAASSRQFFGGLSRLVNLLRDNHTSFGVPSNFSTFAPQILGSSSSVLGACFGVIEKDLLGGGMGYAVFRAAESPVTKTPLKRGDVVFAIDGRDPKQWVDEVYAQVATTLPNDPDSDWGVTANDLGRLVATRASTITLLRCASPSSCDAGNRETITIDVASATYRAITTPSVAQDGTSKPFSCSQRFSDAVKPSGGSASGEDKVDVAIGSVGETRVQFDGFVGQGRWQSSMTNVFAGAPARVLMDARMGHGGYYTTVEHLFHLLRGTSEPMGVLSMGRGTYDLADPPWLLERLGHCVNDRGDSWGCFQGNANGFFASKASPPGAVTRIAWLNTYDVSANDFMPKLLKGRTNVRIFAPHPTSGAFGAVTSLPATWTGYSGGSLQIQDARFASSLKDTGAARWESGHGVEPDVVVVQKLSDALAGVDTILQAATEWLGQ